MSVDRERFSAAEVAVVLSRYDLGVVQSARDLARGSRRSPKMIVRSERGAYLLKRRAAGRDDPVRVAFTHALIQHFRSRRFPVPALVRARDTGLHAVEVEGRTYELFEFVDGESYGGSLAETMHAGKTLARFHKAAVDFHADTIPAIGTFHDAGAVRNGLNSIPTNVSGHDSVVGREAQLLSIVQELHERYDDAAQYANALGVRQMPARVSHGDWHPGNMLFRKGRVVAVLDLDSARLGPRVTDLANGMLQFSVLRKTGDPADWPAYFDEARMRRFVIGYQAIERLSNEELATLPHLMIESLVAEAVLPIALTGSFGPLPGFGVLQMVLRKVRWLDDAIPRIEEWLRA